MIKYFFDYREGSVAQVAVPDAIQQKLPFYVEFCGRLYTADRYFIKRDGLENYLMFITTEGSGEIYYRGERCILEAGSAVVINCRDYHEYHCMPGSIWNFYYLHFCASSIDAYEILFDKLTPVMLRNIKIAEDMMEEICRTSVLHRTSDYYKHSNLISGLLTEMVCSLESNTERVTVRKDITELAEYIRIHFREELHIEDFMRKTSLSRHYLIHLFQEQLGVTPYKYLHICRVRYSEFLLKTTDMSVEEIAYNIGYSNPTVYIRHFKKINGITPGMYRRPENYLP